jgi:hypothetical protein
VTVQNERERLEVALLDIISSYMAGHVNTIMPGQIVSFNRSEGTATIQPCFQRVYADRDDPETLPPIEDVPVFFFGSGDRWLTVDLKADSYVILLFAQRALATWFEQGGIVDPAQSRKFALSDAIALAGLIPSPDELPAAIEADSIALRNSSNDSYIKIDGSDDVILQASAPPEGGTSRIYLRSTSDLCQINDGNGTAVEFSRLKTAFDQLKSDFDGLVTIFNAHVHPGVTAGAASTLITATPDTPSTANINPAESSTVQIP